MSYKTHNKTIWLTTLDQDGHEQTAGYWYLITVGAMSHRAFKTLNGLIRYLGQRNLELLQTLPAHGVHSNQSITRQVT